MNSAQRSVLLTFDLLALDRLPAICSQAHHGGNLGLIEIAAGFACDFLLDERPPDMRRLQRKRLAPLWWLAVECGIVAKQDAPVLPLLAGKRVREASAARRQ